MSFRITTNMTMNTYRYNLQSSTKKLSDARDMVLTQRYFNSYAEDPAAATLAFRLRRSWYQTSSYLSNTQDVYSKFNTAWNNLTGVVHDLSDATARVSSIRGNNDTTGEARTSLAIVLRKTAESVIQAMNQKLGDHFIFAGNDALNAPFSWVHGQLLYRGVNVNAGGLTDPKITEPEWGDDYDIAADAQSARDIVQKKAEIAGWQDDIEELKEQMEEEEDPDIVKDLEYDISQLESKITVWEDDIKQLEDGLAWFWKEYSDNYEKINEDEVEDLIKTVTDARDGLPIDMPMKAAGDYEQAWMDYYNGKAGKGDTYPNPEVGPGWAQEALKALEDEDLASTKFLNEDGSPNIEEIKKLLKGDPNAKDEDLRAVDRLWIQYFKDKVAYEQDQEDYKKLLAMSGEEMYIDLGMGAAESSPNNPVTGTYFNSALCGLDFLGFGVDEDGDPKNLALIMQELADVFDDWDEDGQMYLPDGYRNKSREEIQEILNSKNPSVMREAEMLRTYHEQQQERAYRLMDKLKAGQEHTTEMWVELDAQSVYLQSAESRLAVQATDLNIQFLDVEQVDLAEAITNFSWQQYCYNAALKIGNQLLSQSLIDYMN